MYNPLKGAIDSIETKINNEIGHYLNAASEKVDRERPEKAKATLRETLVKNQQHQQTTSAAQAAEMVEQAAKMQEGSAKLDFTQAVEVAVNNLTVAQLVGCQPMQGPVGLVYRIQYKRNDVKDQISLEIVKHAVEAGGKKLNTGMAIEASQDALAVHGLDIEKEIMYAIGKEIATEYNQEVIRDLEHKAHKFESTGVVTSDQELLVHIQRGARSIGIKTRRGIGNWAVVSKAVGKRLMPHLKTIHVDLEDEAASVGQPDLFLFAEHNNIKYYVNVWHMDEHTEGKSSILVGYKGSTEIDTGYILAPFEMIRTNGVVVDPLTFSPIMLLMTRYGKFFAENGEDYYVNIELTFKD